MRADAVERAVRPRKGELAERLHAVRMEYGGGRMFFDEGCDGGKVVDRADFVVDVHNGDERRIFRQRRFQFLQIDRAVRVAADEGDLRVRRAFQRTHGFVYGGMLRRRGDHAPLAADGLERAKERHIVRLRPAGGKKNLVRSRAKRGGQPRAGRFDGALRLDGGRVRAGGIIELFGHRAVRRVRRFGQDARSRAVIQIDHLGSPKSVHLAGRFPHLGSIAHFFAPCAFFAPGGARRAQRRPGTRPGRNANRRFYRQAGNRSLR